jgi:hypothetical protein
LSFAFIDRNANTSEKHKWKKFLSSADYFKKVEDYPFFTALQILEKEQAKYACY